MRIQEEDEIGNEEDHLTDRRRKAFLRRMRKFLVSDTNDGSDKDEVKKDKIVEPSSLICLDQNDWDRQ